MMPTSVPISDGDAVGDDADDQRGPRAEEEAREQVAAQQVGAEPDMLRRAAAARLRGSGRRRTAGRADRARSTAPIRAASTVTRITASPNSARRRCRSRLRTERGGE